MDMSIRGGQSAALCQLGAQAQEIEGNMGLRPSLSINWANPRTRPSRKASLADAVSTAHIPVHEREQVVIRADSHTDPETDTRVCGATKMHVAGQLNI